jgi:rhamnose transport system ATP-binding protein
LTGLAAPTPTAVELRGVSKRFGAFQALRNIDLDIVDGEVLALVGENGAGKSTLVKILAGVHHPDQGTVSVAGRHVDLHGPSHARSLGIAVIHQQPNLFPDLSVAENVAIADIPRDSLKRVDWRQMQRRARELFDSLGTPLPVNAPVRGLSIADQQLIEIAKALAIDAHTLVMDEPTAALSSREVERLFGIVRDLRGRGVAILFVSHHIEEVFELSQRVAVLRDGAHVVTAATSSMTPGDLIRHMVGRSVETLFPKEPARIGELVLEVRHLSHEGEFGDVSLALHRGEVLGIAGLVGAGRTEVARSLFGIDRADSGEILVAGKPLRIGSPSDAMRNGIAYVPEDRHQHGLVLDFSIASNVSLPILHRLFRFLVGRRREHRLAAEYVERLQVRTRGVDQPARSLSGGNQQKVVLAKWLASNPAILILDEPTRGIDIGAKAEVHRIISELAAGGMGIVLVSSELPEVLAMSDRVLVMREGHVVARLERDEATQERVMVAATGQDAAHDEGGDG